MRIAFGNDQAGYDMRDEIISYLSSLGYEVIDYGAHREDGSVDYPDYAEKVARAVAKKEADFGVLMCGTGIGMCIAANKVKGIRCAVCTDPYGAEMTRRHNNANIIALRAREITLEQNLEVLKRFFQAVPDDQERHKNRIAKIARIENANLAAKE